MTGAVAPPPVPTPAYAYPTPTPGPIRAPSPAPYGAHTRLHGRDLCDHALSPVCVCVCVRVCVGDRRRPSTGVSDSGSIRHEATVAAMINARKEEIQSARTRSSSVR